ncbi:hypothetical protein [Legionella sp.]|uniref:hypothetical protein n=1 Tax=Legionella sp. TaxID=459 RepID=UPI003C98BA07
MEVLKQVEELVSAKISVIKAVLTLIQPEAQLAGLSVFPLLLNLCMLLIVLMTFWLLTSLFIGYGILLISNNFPLSLILVLLFNLIALWGLIKYLAFNIKNMSFEKTRSYFLQNKGNKNEFKKTITSKNSDDGQDIASTTNSGDGT